MSVDYRPEMYKPKKKTPLIKSGASVIKPVVDTVNKISYSNNINTSSAITTTINKIKSEADDVYKFVNSVAPDDELLKVQEAIDKDIADTRTILPLLFMVSSVNSYFLDVEQTLQELIVSDSVFSVVDDMSSVDAESIFYLLGGDIKLSRAKRESLCDKSIMCIAVENLYSSILVYRSIIDKTKSDAAIYSAHEKVEECKNNLARAIATIRNSNNLMLDDIHELAFLIKEFTGDNIY